MNDPISKIYSSYGKWLEKITDLNEKKNDEFKQNAKYKWYSPGDASISILDRDDISKLFERDDIQEDYKEWTKGEGVLYDAVVMRFQNSALAADERSFRIRHSTLPWRCAHGGCASMLWGSGSNKQLFTQYIGDILGNINADKEARFNKTSTEQK